MSEKPEIEILDAEQPPKKRSTKKRWLLFLGIFLIVLLLLVVFLLSNSTALDGVKRFFRYLGKDDTQYGKLQFETYGTCSYALVDGRFAVATQSGAYLYAENGSAAGRVQQSFSHPALKSAAERLLVYDIGGTRLALLDSDGTLLYETEVANTIYDAELSAEGYVSVLYEGVDCRATLEVYEESGALLYRRNSKTNYLNTCAISSDGSYAVVSTLGQEDISFRSTLQFLKTDSEDIAAEVSCGSELIYELAFLNKDSVCAVGETKLMFFDLDGTLRGEYSDADGELELYAFGGEDYLTAAYDLYDATGNYQIVSLDAGGNVIASAAVADAPLSLTACGSYIAVLTEQELLIYDRELNLHSRRENSGYQYALARADGTAMCVSPGEAELYIP